MYVKWLDKPEQVFKRGNPYVAAYSPAAGRATRLPSGHPEAFIEAMANIYLNFADTVRANLLNQTPDPLALDFPTVYDGLRGMQFLATLLDSANSEQKWTAFKK